MTLFYITEYPQETTLCAKLDTDQWVHAAKAAGAQYAIFTATHFNGFMQWQSNLYPYGLKYASWRDGQGDIVGDFVKSCRKANILPGIYLSTHRNAYMTVWGHYSERLCGSTSAISSEAFPDRAARLSCH